MTLLGCTALWFLSLKVSVQLHGSYEGVFVLKGRPGEWLEITDDLFPEDSSRFIWGEPTTAFKKVIATATCEAGDQPCTSFEWNETTGRGFIKASSPNGHKLLFNLSRFKDSDGLTTSGLFLGGGLPPSDADYNLTDPNETGMAFYDGKRYFHIWCNANEGIADATNHSTRPSHWQFINSKVLESSDRGLTLTSSHRAMVNSVPVKVERFLYYQTGDSFITLVTSITNIGSQPTMLAYVYGDEPWLGNFGSSAGNIGWLKDRLVTTEAAIDTDRNNFAGMYDSGNPLAEEGNDFTHMANFIEWSRDTRPTFAYFSNRFGSFAPASAGVPLASPNSRIIALQWGPDTLEPNQTFSFTMAIGMARADAKTGIPVKPDTRLN